MAYEAIGLPSSCLMALPPPTPFPPPRPSPPLMPGLVPTHCKTLAFTQTYKAAAEEIVWSSGAVARERARERRLQMMPTYSTYDEASNEAEVIAGGPYASYDETLDEGPSYYSYGEVGERLETTYNEQMGCFSPVCYSTLIKTVTVGANESFINISISLSIPVGDSAANASSTVATITAAIATFSANPIAVTSILDATLISTSPITVGDRMVPILAVSLQCPAHAVPLSAFEGLLGANETQSTRCACAANYYNFATNGSVLCRPCPAGVICAMPGNTAQTLPFDPYAFDPPWRHAILIVLLIAVVIAIGGACVYNCKHIDEARQHLLAMSTAPTVYVHEVEVTQRGRASTLGGGTARARAPTLNTTQFGTTANELSSRSDDEAEAPKNAPRSVAVGERARAPTVGSGGQLPPTGRESKYNVEASEGV